MALFKRGNIWYIQYFFGARRIRKAVGPLKKEAEAALGKIKGVIREGRYFEKKEFPQITIEELADRYKEWGRVKKSFNNFDAVNLKPILEFFKGRLISKITEYDVETFRAHRKMVPTKAKMPEARRPRSNSTLNHELGTLKQLFNKAVAWGFAEKNPTAKVKLLPTTKGRTRFLTVEEAGALLRAAPGHLRPILLAALETGMRRGEIMNLKWADVDMKGGMIYVAETKTGRPRHIPMSSRLRATLGRLPRRLGSNYVFTGIKRFPKIGRDGEPFHDVRTSFENACRRAGIEGFRFHDLRHTAASHMVMAGVPFKTVGEILGHTTAAMTERYSHLTPEHKRKAVEMLPEWEATGATCPKTAPE